MKLSLPKIRPLQSLVPDGRDWHIYPGMVLAAWGLWSSPLPWLAPLVVGAVLWWMGIFRLSKPKQGD